DASSFSGSQSRRGKSEQPRSLNGRQEGNRMLSSQMTKPPTRAVSESPGRNECERAVAPKSRDPEAEPSQPWRKQNGTLKLGDKAAHSGGVISDGTATRTSQATGETLLAPGESPGEW